VGTNLIPVPSRLYFPPPSETKPLSGKRLAIKDIYDIRGLKTSMCCRSYEACYHESSQTAKAIQILIILGAVIVAKAKTSQLVSGLGPLDWIDYQCPFNPRGDGYLNPNCSSTGSAVGIAAYDWLDCSIGSDSMLFLIKSVMFRH
jgi:Asp-tRNA(Asn)/Glu-tRNA(Gln) amidotransferase A subunit family amidase